MVETPAPNSDDVLNDVLKQIEDLSKSTTSSLKPWSAPDWENLLAPIEDKADGYVNALIDAAVGSDDSAPQVTTKSGAFTENIKSRREKLALTSSTTTQIVGICQQILAFGAAGLALSVGFSDKLHTFSLPAQRVIVLTGIFYVELVGLSLVVLMWYLLQAHFRYPFLYFRKIGNTWPYFYYASISREISRSPVESAKQRFIGGKLYAQDFAKFSRSCLNETPKQRLRSELQQYFLLISYQGYSQQFALRLSNLFSYGFVGAAVSTLLIAAWAAVK